MNHTLKTLSVLTACAFALTACSSSGIQKKLDELIKDNAETPVVTPSTGTNNGNQNTGNQPGNPETPENKNPDSTTVIKVKEYKLSAEEQKQKADIWLTHGIAQPQFIEGTIHYKNDPTPHITRTMENVLTINGKRYSGKEYPNATRFHPSGVNIAVANHTDFKYGFSNLKATHYLKTKDMTNGEIDEENASSDLRLYHLPYSMAFGIYSYDVDEDGTLDNRNIEYGGIPTASLPANNTYTYRGTAFNKDEKGNVEYNITFKPNNKGFGEGKTTGMTSYGDIVLNKGNIEATNHITNLSETAPALTQFGISGQATFKGDQSGHYALGIYGPVAEEIAGEVTTPREYIRDTENNGKDKDSIGFAAQR